MMAQPYRYTALESSTSIRLLRVASHPEPEHPPSFSLVDVRLDDESRTPYVCLSYTWGSHTPKGEEETSASSNQRSRVCVMTSIVGNSVAGAIPITPNLDAFLGRLVASSIETTVHIWIDAICVNQEDANERASQVGLMSRIYSSCEEVIVWLGVDDDASNTAMKLLTSCQQATTDLISGWILRQGGKVAVAQALKLLGLDASDPKDWLTFGTFLDRNWFHRTWTFQEVLLPHKVIFWCGKNEFGPNELLVGLELFDRMGVYPSIRFSETDPVTVSRPGLPERVVDSYLTLRNLMKQVYMRTNPGLKFTLASTMFTEQNLLSTWIRIRQCTDVRDSVYGVLGISGTDVIVDYQKTPAEVFIEYSLALGIEKFVPYDIEHRSYRRTPGLPSWVPDFSVPLLPREWRTAGGTGYFAGGKGVMKPLTSSDRRVLTLSGMIVDTIETVAGRFADISSGQFLVDVLTALDNLPSVEGYADIVETLWRTLIIDGSNRNHPNAAEYGPSFLLMSTVYLSKWIFNSGVESAESGRLQQVLESLRQKSQTPFLPQWCRLLELSVKFEGNEGQFPILEEPERQLMLFYADRFNQMFSDRCIFLTRNGRMGIGLDFLQPGALVSVVQGCEYPILLENSDDGQYKFAGYGYVNGIMKGEACKSESFIDLEII